MRNEKFFAAENFSAKVCNEIGTPMYKVQKDKNKAARDKLNRQHNRIKLLLKRRLITMNGFNEFKTRVENDAEFAAKFKGAKNESQLIAMAKAEGYNLEQLSDAELDNVAGGSALGDKIKQAWDWITS